MKAVLPRQDLYEALQAASSLVSARTTRPILECVRLSLADNTLRIAATDGEAGLRLSVGAISVGEPGEVVVSAQRLLSIVRELGDVEITVQTDERHCTVRGQGANFRLYAADPADFPPVQGFEDSPDLVIGGQDLRRMIELTLYAAARETTRYAINGVLWEKQGKRLYLVATDGRRLARAGGTVVRASSGDFQAIVPARALSVFERVFTPPRGLETDEPWTVDVRVMPNQIVLRSGDRVLSTVLVEGHFPKYQEVIPTDNDKRARLDRQELFSAVKLAALMTTEDSRAVRLEFNEDRLAITAQSPEQGDARVEIPVEYQGEGLVIGFNPAFLGDALKVLSCEQVVLEMRESFRPGVLSGEDKDEFLYVVMPVSLTS